MYDFVGVSMLVCAGVFGCVGARVCSSAHERARVCSHACLGVSAKRLGAAGGEGKCMLSVYWFCAELAARTDAWPAHWRGAYVTVTY